MNPNERLTKRYSSEPIPKRSICKVIPKYMCKRLKGCGKCPIGKMINRLCEYEDTGLAPTEIMQMKAAAAQNVETNVFDKETTIENCTVQILENTVTGECSVGWRKNEPPAGNSDLIDRDALIENFKTSGQFDISELGAIIPIIEEQPVIAYNEDDE